MTYQVVYDVLDSVWSVLDTGESRFLLFSLGIAILVILLYWRGIGYLNGRPVSDPEQGCGNLAGMLLFLGVFIVIGVWMVATNNYPAYLEHLRFKEWVRQGDYQTVEGAITDFSAGRKYNDSHFRVGDVRFTYSRTDNSKGSFRGQFTAPGTEDLRLQNGLKVRIAHREERILRIEIAE
jgi:hypothetical protein